MQKKILPNNKLSSMGPVYVINLEHRTDRRDYMINQLEKYGVKNYKKLPAYNGHNIKGEYEMSKGEIGCSMSHLLAIKDWYESEYESDYLIVMEDDLAFETVDHWDWDWEQFLNSIAFKYDLIHLAPSGVELEVPDDFRILKFNRDDIPIYFTTCYLITKDGAREVLRKNTKNGKIKFDFNDRNNVADWKIIYGAVQNGYKIPLFAANDSLGTDIEGHHEEKYSAFFHGVRRHTNELLKNCKKPLSEILTPN